MQGPVLAARPGLEGRLVARHRREVVPHPPDHLLGLLHAAEAVREGGLVRPKLGLGQLGVLGVPACWGMSLLVLQYFEWLFSFLLCVCGCWKEDGSYQCA